MTIAVTHPLSTVIDGTTIVYDPVTKTIRAVPGVAAGATFTYAANRTLDANIAAYWAQSNTLSGDMAVTVTNASEALEVVVLTKQDGTGGRAVSFAASGWTARYPQGQGQNIQDTEVASAVTAWRLKFATVAGVPYMRIAYEIWEAVQ